MPEDAGCPTVPAASAAQAKALLRAAAPGRTNPAGERVVVAPEWELELDHDPERLSLVPVALTALEHPHEIWRLSGSEPGPSAIEHQPHLLWCRPGEGAAGELCVAGTRRIDGALHLHTWFRVANPEATLRRYWATGTLVYPTRRFHAVYSARRDVLYLHPEPHGSYRVMRLTARASVFGYVDARLGFPSLRGFEAQDARRRGALLLEEPELASLLATPCLLDDDAELRPLRDHLARLLG